MKPAGIATLALLAFGLSATAQQQLRQPPDDSVPTVQTAPRASTTLQKQSSGAGHDIGSGSGDIGKGAAKGAGNLAKGTGKGAADLVTLHPVDAAANVGKGAAVAGKDVGVGTAKGTGKIVKGTGKALKKVF